MSTRQNTLHEDELIAQAEVECDHHTLVESTANPGKLLAACELFMMNGCADAESGNVESPTGHFYRVHRWIVTTDNYGFKDVETYDSETEAIVAFEQRADEYCLWAGDDE